MPDSYKKGTSHRDIYNKRKVRKKKKIEKEGEKLNCVHVLIVEAKCMAYIKHFSFLYEN
jgi:hypothetical protein